MWKYTGVDDPDCMSSFFCQPPVQASATPRFSQPAGANITRVYSHLTLVRSFFPPMVPDPQSGFRWELVVPSWDLTMTTSARQWSAGGIKRHCLVSQLFPSGPVLKFSCRILDSSTLFQEGEFISAPIMNKTATPSRLLATSSDISKSDIAARRKLADLVSVQNLLLFLTNCAGEFKSTLPLHDPEGIWLSMHQLLTGAVMVIQSLVLDVMGSACRVCVKL